MKKISLSTILILLSTSFLYSQDKPITHKEQPITTEIEEEYRIESVEDNDIPIVTSKNQYFDIEILKVKQNPLNKEILLKVYITSKIDSPHTQLIWDAPSSVEITPKHSKYTSLSTNQTSQFEAIIKPKKQGTFVLSFTALAWQHDINKSNSVNYKFTLNKSLVVQPPDSRYIFSLTLISLVVILLVSGVIYGVVKGVRFLILKLKKWITPPSL